MNAKRKNTLRRLPPVTADEQAVADLIEKVRYLLEWMPICSIGSSGHLRRVAVEQAIAKLEGHTGRNMILAPLPAGVEDTPEVRRTLQAYVDGDQPAAKDKGTGWGGMHDPLPDSARSASAYDLSCWRLGTLDGQRIVSCSFCGKTLQVIVTSEAHHEPLVIFP